MSSLNLVFFLAARNVLRYRKRTLQTFLILCCGTFCIILIDAYMRGFAASSAERVVSQCGHIDVHAAGYLDSSEAMPLDLSIPDAEAVMARLLESAAGSTSPNVRPLVAPSVVVGCMLSNGEVSRGALVLATEPWARTLPGQAAMLNPLLSDAAESIVSGSFFHDPSERGAIVDEKYASRLGIGVAEPLILLGNDSYGSFSMLEVPVIGLAREASLPGEAG